MSIKIIATDLDGTLLDKDHITVTERTKAALKRAHEKGIKIAIATGRTLGFITPVTDQIPFIDYVIFSNGASVYDIHNKKIIYKNHISSGNTAEYLKKLDATDIYYNVYVDGKVYFQRDKQKFYTSRELPEDFLKLFLAASTECINLCDTLKNKSSEIVAVYSENEALRDELANYFKSLGLLVTASLKDEIEATLPSANKGTALKGICELFGIKNTEAMSFGDALNDAPMIEYAGYSFAMDNACEELKELSKYIAPSNTQDGVAQMIEKYAL